MGQGHSFNMNLHVRLTMAAALNSRGNLPAPWPHPPSSKQLVLCVFVPGLIEFLNLAAVVAMLAVVYAITDPLIMKLSCSKWQAAHATAHE